MKRKYPFKKIQIRGIDSKVITLFLLVCIASFFLIVINFYSLKITAAVRAYTNGESEYSKGQKDALLYLTAFIQTEDEKYWALFQKEIQVPMEDNIARKALLNDVGGNIAANAFLAARNHPEDINGLIWLFKNFKNVSFMQKAIQVWADAEPLINDINRLGSDIHKVKEENQLTPDKKSTLILQINTISADLSQRERLFSNTLGNAARTINSLLFIGNFVCIILILGSLIAYAIIMVNRLSLNAVDLNKKNGELINTNKEMDVFIFSASHDMRSPITSTKGLIDIALAEEDITRIKGYLKLLKSVANKQDVFIQEIIDFFKNKRTAISISKVNLPDLVSDVLDQHWYAIEADGITIETKLDIGQFYCDELRVRMILNNLISNSVKYSDKRKTDKKIRIRAWKSLHDFTIEVEDNGIGIKKEKQASIFNMFFVTETNKKSSGLGLYIVHETVMKLNGAIELHSEVNTGTKITIRIPLMSILHENETSFKDLQVLQ